MCLYIRAVSPPAFLSASTSWSCCSCSTLTTFPLPVFFIALLRDTKSVRTQAKEAQNPLFSCLLFSYYTLLPNNTLQIERATSLSLFASPISNPSKMLCDACVCKLIRLLALLPSTPRPGVTQETNRVAGNEHVCTSKIEPLRLPLLG